MTVRLAELVNARSGTKKKAMFSASRFRNCQTDYINFTQIRLK